MLRLTFDENFWQQILPRIKVFFKRAVVPELFKEVKNCINMVAGGTNEKKKKKNGYFNSHTL